MSRQAKGSVSLAPTFAFAFAVAVVSFRPSAAVIFFFAASFVTFILIAPISLPVMRYINIIVPFIADEIDGSSAGVIFLAVFTPISLLSRRHMKIERRLFNAPTRGDNDDGFFINNLGRRCIPDVDAAIKTGFADSDGYVDIGGLRRHRKENNHRNK